MLQVPIYTNSTGKNYHKWFGSKTFSLRKLREIKKQARRLKKRKLKKVKKKKRRKKLMGKEKKWRLKRKKSSRRMTLKSILNNT